jgi:hypothetical protein
MFIDSVLLLCSTPFEVLRRSAQDCKLQDLYRSFLEPSNGVGVSLVSCPARNMSPHGGETQCFSRLLTNRLLLFHGDSFAAFQIDLPPGKYEMRSDKLPGFGATKREISVATKQVADVTIVPAVSEEGVLCILRVTGTATPKQRTRKRHR